MSLQRTATYCTKIAAQQPRLAVKAHVQARHKRGHDEEGDADIVDADPEVGQLARVAEQGVVGGGQAEAGGAGDEVDVEDGAVGEGGGGIAGGEVAGEGGVAEGGDDDAGYEVRVDVAALVVQVGPAAEAGRGGGEDGPVAGADVRVLAVPCRHAFNRQQQHAAGGSGGGGRHARGGHRSASCAAGRGEMPRRERGRRRRGLGGRVVLGVGRGTGVSADGRFTAIHDAKGDELRQIGVCRGTMARRGVSAKFHSISPAEVVDARLCTSSNTQEVGG